MQVAGTGPPGAVAAAGALTGAVPSRFQASRSSVRFVSPATMKISWYVPGGTGKGSFSANQLEVPGRYNFVQAAIYRLKLTDIPGHPNLELYPTLEVVPANLKTTAFLAHSSVPISFTEEDFEQVVAGNFVVKVVYLPDPQFQDLAVAGPEEIVSSRLEPGVDPIAEAYRRGSILLVVRLGNIDLELANSPAMDAPGQHQQRAPAPGMPMHGMPTPGMPGMPGMPGVPHGMMPSNGPMMGVPSMQTAPTPYAPSGMPIMSMPSLPAPMPGQTSRLPEPASLQATQFSGVSTAGQPSDASSADKKSDKKTANRSWWWGGGDSDKK
jgi:hypothetical protein